MKKIKYFIIILTTYALLYADPGRSGTPSVERSVFENGVTFLHVRDALPVTSIVAAVGLGSLHETGSNAGLSDLIALCLSQGGTLNYPESAHYERIEALGGEFSVSASFENTFISLKVLSRHTDAALEIMKDILLSPNFSSAVFSRSRDMYLDKIKRDEDDPAGKALNGVKKIIFSGKGYGAIADNESVKSISSADLTAAWKRYYCGRNIIMAVSSPLDFGDISSRTRSAFSGLNAGEKAKYDFDYAAAVLSLKKSEDTVYFMEKNLPQATVAVGGLAPALPDCDEYSLTVMNFILGGGSFNSRLMSEIRVKRGLAYSVQSVLRNRKKAGVFLAFAQTGIPHAGNVLKLLRDNVYLMQSAAVQPEEMEWAKKSIVNSHIFRFDSAGAILSNSIFIEYNTLPPAYFEEYPLKISGVTDSSVKESASALLSSPLVFLVLGPAELKENLKQYGRVVETGGPDGK